MHHKQLSLKAYVYIYGHRIFIEQVNDNSIKQNKDHMTFQDSSKSAVYSGEAQK